MDLESESSALESVEDNEGLSPERLSQVYGNKIENNGSRGNEFVDDGLLADVKNKDVGVSDLVTVKSSGGSVESSPPCVGSAPAMLKIKGFGLKKWRRIKREISKDGSSSLDTSKILKRGSATLAANSTKPKEKRDGSLSPTGAIARRTGSSIDGFTFHGSGLDVNLPLEPTFASRTDSENSEYWSSTSTTAAIFPKSTVGMGHPRDRNRTRNQTGKNLVNSMQRGQQGKGRTESSQKPRGEQIKIVKENSHSSMESDSQSSNFVYMQGTNSVTSNGRQHQGSTNYDGENSDEAEAGEQQFSNEHQIGHHKENGREFEGNLQGDVAADSFWKAKEKAKSSRPSTDHDPLAESIYSLQSVQEMLEKEVKELREIGSEHVSLSDGSSQDSSLPSEFTSTDPIIHRASTSGPLHSGEIGERSSSFSETQVTSLKQEADLLTRKLEESMAMLKQKEAEVVELENAVRSSKTPEEDIQRKRQREMEAEIDGLFRQNIQAEIEHITISRAIQKLRALAVEQISLVEEQNSVVLEQAQILNQFEDAKRKALMLKKKAEKLETLCEDVVGEDEVLKMENRVCKVSSCFLIQLILLLVVLALVVLQLSPHYVGVVPT